MYRIKFSDVAKKQFLKLDTPIQERIGAVLERICIRPADFVEKLVGEPGYKLRIGDYRVFLEIYNNDLVILVIKIGHRKSVYK